VLLGLTSTIVVAQLCEGAPPSASCGKYNRVEAEEGV
jgi:hypothetical protein